MLAGFAGHQVRSERELARRCQIWRAVLPRDGDTFTVPGPAKLASAGPRAQRVLVLGGSGSGKSAEAEWRLAAEPSVTYVATGQRPGPEDAEWAARVAAHRERRPAWWRTVETGTEPAALARELGCADGRAARCWSTASPPGWPRPWTNAGPGTVPRTRPGGWPGWSASCWRPGGRTARYVVAVSDEVGLSVVPPTRAGRIFRDELGSLNQRLAADADDFVMMVAGRRLITAD